MWTKCWIWFAALLGAGLLSSCGGQVKANTRVAYQYKAGKTAVLRNGKAYAPPGAPAEVKRAIAAANSIAGLPYKWGGGHAQLNDRGYDCSGATSYVLRNAGLLNGQMPSRGFLNYGKRGEGRWITAYVRNGHVFLVIAGLRFDTQGQRKDGGPQWSTSSRSGKGHILRHPERL
jgi:hypothetical protein